MRLAARLAIVAIPALMGAGAAVQSSMASAEPAGPPQSVELAEHRAVYDLTLADSRGKQAIQSAEGRILYDFTGNQCEGYTLNFRQVTELDSGEGARTVSDLRATNWEAGDGKRFRFTTHNTIDGNDVDVSEGSAERNGDTVTVTMVKPQRKRFDVGKAIFPSDHMRRIIATARQGGTLLETTNFDGTENGEKVYNSLAVIGRAIPPGEKPPAEAAAAQEALKNLTRWPVSISYFDRAEKGGDQMPSYAIRFELYENGVARAVKLDYGSFVLNGTLSSLDVKPVTPCQ